MDFSSVNDYKKSATYYIFGTTLILPFAVTAACGLVVLMNHYSGSLPDNIVNFKIIYFGSLLSFICCFPYYVINFMNGSGHFIPRHANFVSTFFFYNSSLCLTIPYLLYRRPKCRKSTKSTKNAHSYSNSNGIQEDIQMEQEYSKVDYVWLKLFRSTDSLLFSKQNSLDYLWQKAHKVKTAFRSAKCIGCLKCSADKIKHENDWSLFQCRYFSRLPWWRTLTVTKARKKWNIILQLFVFMFSFWYCHCRWPSFWLFLKVNL